jgi:methylenetetrahydrofolate dehydrogenase (NADP+)/methenyltetrahydrofolate cyclohydrolase
LPASETATERGGIIDGTAVAKKIRARVAEDVRKLVARGTVPGLHVVLVGDDPASAAYVMSKGKASAEAGINGITTRMPASTSQAELLTVVGRLNADPSVHGILVQMPLPKQIDPDSVIRCIDPRKDVDGFHPVNVGKLLIGDSTAFAPCTPSGVMILLREYGVKTAGANVVVIGRSNIVGKPMASLLMQPGVDATVTVCHSRTRDLANHTRQADVVIAAAGRPGMLTGDMVKGGAVVIDVGINRVDDASTPKGYRLVGDVDFNSVRNVASLVTPVPGGVGPMTIAMLLDNTLRSATRFADGSG